MAASRSLTAMATWSISVSTSRTVATVQRDLVLTDVGALLGVVDAEALLRGQAQHADLAFVLVAVDPACRLARLLEWVHGRQERLDPALADELVGRPRLGVVGEVRGDEPLQLHPQVAVVELDHVARSGGTRDDGAAALADEDRRPHRLAARVLEHDLGIVADERPDVLAEPSPLRLVVALVVGPEPVAGRLPVDDGFDAQFVEQLGLL